MSIEELRYSVDCCMGLLIVPLVPCDASYLQENTSVLWRIGGELKFNDVEMLVDRIALGADRWPMILKFMNNIKICH